MNLIEVPSRAAQLRSAVEVFLRTLAICTVVVATRGLWGVDLTEGRSWLSSLILVSLYLPSTAVYVLPLALFWTLLRCRGVYQARVLATLVLLVAAASGPLASVFVPQLNRAYSTAYTEGGRSLAASPPARSHRGESEMAASELLRTNTYRAKLVYTYRLAAPWLCLLAALSAAALAVANRLNTPFAATVTAVLIAVGYDGLSSGLSAIAESRGMNEGGLSWAAASVAVWAPAFIVLGVSTWFGFRTSPLATPVPVPFGRSSDRNWFSRVAGIALVGILTFLAALEISRGLPQLVDRSIATALAALASAVALLIFAPRWQTEGIRASDLDRFRAEGEARKVLAQVMGGALLVASVYAAGMQLKNSQEVLRLSALSQTQAFDAQRHERFSQAIAQLGASSSPEVQIGAIFSLEKFAKDSTADTLLIVRTLAAFVRQTSPWPAQEAKSRNHAAIEAAVSAIGQIERPERMQPYYDYGAVLPEPVDLSRTDLRDLTIREADLRSVSFRGANLDGSTFHDVQLDNADFASATFRDGVIQGNASVERVWFSLMDLSGTLIFGRFRNVSIERSTLRRTAMHFSADSLSFDASDLAHAWVEVHLKHWDMGQPSSVKFASFASRNIPREELDRLRKLGAVACQERWLVPTPGGFRIVPVPEDPAGPSPEVLWQNAELVRSKCPDLAGLPIERVEELIASWTHASRQQR